MNTQKFITNCIDNRIRVSVFLVNGVSLKGVIQTVAPEGDSFTLAGEGGVAQLIMVTAVSTIMPSDNFGNR